MATSSVSSRVAVIGAGPGGLASAPSRQGGAACDGVRARASRGGRTRTLQTPADTGSISARPSSSTPHPIRHLRACGERLEDHVELKRLDPQYHVIFEGGGEIRATPDLARLEQEIARLCPADARNIGRFLADNRERSSEAFRPVLEQGSPAPSDLMCLRCAPRSPRSGPSRRRQGSEALPPDPRVRLAFSFQSKYLGMSPFNCPSLFSILSFLEYEHGVFHPLGAAGAVTQAMATGRTELGGESRRRAG